MAAPTLPLIVLHKLNERPHTGYSLSKEIHTSTGQKPSFGSIYPILEKMMSAGIVTMREEGRKKIYTLTAKGKKAAGDLQQQRVQLIESMITQSKMFCEVTRCDPTPMVALFERLKKGEQPLGPITEQGVKLRNLMIQMAHDGRAERHTKEINSVLAQTIKRLEKLT